MNGNRFDNTIRPLGLRGLDRRSLLRLTGAGAGTAVLAGMPGLARQSLAVPSRVQGQPGGTLTYA